MKLSKKQEDKENMSVLSNNRSSLNFKFAEKLNLKSSCTSNISKEKIKQS